MKRIKLTEEWQALVDLANGTTGLGTLPKADETANLNKKIMWFLKSGPVGILQNILAVFGSEGLEEFKSFLDYYLEDQGAPGHYQPSKGNDSAIKALKNENSDTDFSVYLANLKQELRELDGDKTNERRKNNDERIP